MIAAKRTGFFADIPRLVVLFCTLLTIAWSGPARAAEAANGVWSSSGGGYLAVLADSSSGTAVVLQVNATLNGGTVFVGSRSGNTIVARDVVDGTTMSLTFAGNQYSGQLTRGSSSSALSGQLLLAYQGSVYDGVWQREGASDRYPVVLSVNAGGAPLTVLIDVKLNSTAVSYDVATGAIGTAGVQPTFVGRSLGSGLTVSLAFQGGNPAAGLFSMVDTTTRPTRMVEQFNVQQRIAVAP